LPTGQFIQFFQKVVTVNRSLTLKSRTLPYLPVLVLPLGTFFLPGLKSALVTGGATMKKPDWSPRQDFDAPTQAAREAQNLPPGPEGFEAMKKAHGLRHAADTCNYLFSCELKPPD
jgi:hypothetical protein